MISDWNAKDVNFSTVEPLPDSQSRIDRFLSYSVDDRSIYRSTVVEEDEDDIVIEVDAAGIATARERRKERRRREEREGERRERRDDRKIGNEGGSWHDEEGGPTCSCSKG